MPNAAHGIARLIASLHDADGHVAVPGFYDGIPDLDLDERSAVAPLPFDEDTFFAAIEAVPSGETGFSALERLWLRPTIEVNGTIICPRPSISRAESDDELTFGDVHPSSTWTRDTGRILQAASQPIFALTLFVWGINGFHRVRFGR